jgi:hypothetical protein
MFRSAVCVAIGIIIGAMSASAWSSLRDITIRKPTGEVAIILGADANEQQSISCPSCGLTYFVDMQLRGPLEDQVLTLTYWYDHLETSRAKNRLSLPGEWHGWSAESP